mmetsp:Transcript_27895/g.36289  ORF Transcript_27895/g.36289 Transcript_27895/m.36289 type:complete len:229 (+) Transcript_27895:38-724(+)
MASGFISTAILSSKDGVGYHEEERKETDEVKLAEKRQKEGSSKPLYMQLAEQQEKKQEEYDAVTKLIFSGPRKLDEEDVEHYESLAEKRQKAFELKRKQEEDSISSFTAEQKMRVIKTVKEPQAKQGKPAELLASSNNQEKDSTEESSHQQKDILQGRLKLKPKQHDKEKKKKKKKSKKKKKDSLHQGDTEIPKKRKVEVESKKEPGSDKSPSTLTSLVAYDSHSDSN